MNKLLRLLSVTECLNCGKTNYRVMSTKQASCGACGTDYIVKYVVSARNPQELDEWEQDPFIIVVEDDDYE